MPNPTPGKWNSYRSGPLCECEESYREIGHAILDVWYVCRILRLHVLHLGQKEGTVMS
jgi:hypothetical protein